MPKSFRSRRPALERRLPRYAAAGLAAASSSTHAALVYLDSSHAFTVGPGQGHSWDIAGTGNVNFTFVQDNGSVGVDLIANQYLANFNCFAYDRRAEGEIHPYVFQFGQTVSALLPTHAAFQHTNVPAILTVGGAASSPLAFGTQFIGFEFCDGPDPFDRLYGWASITIASQSITINDWVYNNTPRAAVQVGVIPVPEPAQAATGLGLLALGAAGVSAYQRRRHKAA